MFVIRILQFRYLTIAIIILILATSAYALAAANNVTASKAGEGVGSINPYIVTNIKYMLRPNNPRRIKSVQLDVNPTGVTPAPAEVQARIDTGVWINCTGGPVIWNCSFNPPYPRVSTTPPTTLQVVAAQ